MDKYNVAYQAYSPLGQGLANAMFKESAVMEAANAHQKTPSQILLRFLIQSGVSVIPKSAHKNRIVENIDIFDFTLTNAEMKALQALDKAKPLIGEAEKPEKVETAMSWQ